MICSPIYSNRYDGLIAIRQSELCSSSNLSLEPTATPMYSLEEETVTRFSHFLLSFCLSLSMATISSGLSVQLKKKKMKAKFNREAYAHSIQESANMAEERTDHLQINTFEQADYSYHIKETAGKVVDCSEAWFK